MDGLGVFGGVLVHEFVQALVDGEVLFGFVDLEMWALPLAVCANVDLALLGDEGALLEVDLVLGVFVLFFVVVLGLGIVCLHFIYEGSMIILALKMQSVT